MTKKAKRRTRPSKGDLNRLIDQLCHPHFKERPELILIDTLLHALTERNPPLTIRKFLRHNLSQLIEER